MVAEKAGFARVSLIDHVWQISVIGPRRTRCSRPTPRRDTWPACTTRMELLAWVTAVVYREPGLLAKLVSTLDVLSEGRAWLGVGASWKEEARGLGLPFPPTAERFERPEEALQISCRCGSADEGPFEGEHCRLGRNAQLSAAAVRAASAVLIGGTGEKKTLRLVAVTPRPAACSRPRIWSTSSTCCASTAMPVVVNTTRSRRR